MNDGLKGLYLTMLDRFNTVEDVRVLETLSAIYIKIRYKWKGIRSFTRHCTLYKQHEQYDQETIFNNAGPKWNKNRKSRGKSS